MVSFQSIICAKKFYDHTTIRQQISDHIIERVNIHVTNFHFSANVKDPSVREKAMVEQATISSILELRKT